MIFLQCLNAGEELTKKLLEQIKPFNTDFFNEESKKLNKIEKIGLSKQIIKMNFDPKYSYRRSVGSLSLGN